MHNSNLRVTFQIQLPRRFLIFEWSVHSGIRYLKSTHIMVRKFSFYVFILHWTGTYHYILSSSSSRTNGRKKAEEKRRQYSLLKKEVLFRGLEPPCLGTIFCRLLQTVFLFAQKNETMNISEMRLRCSDWPQSHEEVFTYFLVFWHRGRRRVKRGSVGGSRKVWVGKLCSRGGFNNHYQFAAG